MNHDGITDTELRKATNLRVAAIRRQTSANQFVDARALAAEHGLILRQHTDWHYTIRREGRRWLSSIYPGKRRLVKSREMPELAPYIKLPENWTLVDVVKGFIEAEFKP